MAPKVTEAHVEARREQILEAATACFSRKGFHQTTMQDICEAAQLSPGAVYTYFPSKESIITAACVANQQQTFQLIDSALQQGETQAVFTQLADAFLFALAQPETAAQLRTNVELWAEGLRNTEVDALMSEGDAGVRARFAELVAQAQERGEINPELDAEAVGRTMIVVYTGLVLQKAREPGMDVGPYVQVVLALYGGRFWHQPGRNLNKR
ncbi:MAG: TetR/AcrR family transcriptional regulator [SAR202 cluster bacterium]|nr:TetR/AcrR family transcriptional regulator [SAR202 cluster bacterium]